MVKKKETVFDKLANSTAKSITEKKKTEELVGISGWLAWFIGVTAIGAAILFGTGVWQILTVASEQSVVEGWELVVMSIYTAFIAGLLYFSRTRVALWIVRILMLVPLAGLIFSTPAEEFGASGGIGLVIWTIYLFVSKRVNNTYVGSEKTKNNKEPQSYGKMVLFSIIGAFAFLIVLGALLPAEEQVIVDKTMTLDGIDYDITNLEAGTYSLEITSTEDITIGLFPTEKDFQLFQAGSNEAKVYLSCSAQEATAFKQECTIEDGSILMIYNPNLRTPTKIDIKVTKTG